MGPPWSQRLLATGLVLALGGCSGTRFGDQLARSFSSPAEPAPVPARPAPAAAPVPPAQAPDRANPPRPDPGTAARPAARPASPASSLQPAPYRVTIKLPAADPSAPAEVVTQALRAAGVSFEVEMIERVRGNGGAAAPAAPSVTPAPAPR